MLASGLPYIWPPTLNEEYLQNHPDRAADLGPPVDLLFARQDPVDEWNCDYRKAIGF